MEDNVSWLPHSNNCLCKLKHLLNHICVTEVLTRPQKPPNMMVYQCRFSQPYSQCPFWARAYVRSRLSLVLEGGSWLDRFVPSLNSSMGLFCSSRRPETEAWGPGVGQDNPWWSQLWILSTTAQWLLSGAVTSQWEKGTFLCSGPWPPCTF